MTSCNLLAVRFFVPKSSTKEAGKGKKGAAIILELAGYKTMHKVLTLLDPHVIDLYGVSLYDYKFSIRTRSGSMVSKRVGHTTCSYLRVRV